MTPVARVHVCASRGTKEIMTSVVACSSSVVGMLFLVLCHGKIWCPYRLYCCQFSQLF